MQGNSWQGQPADQACRKSRKETQWNVCLLYHTRHALQKGTGISLCDLGRIVVKTFITAPVDARHKEPA